MTALDREQTRLGVDLSDSRAVARAIRAALAKRSAVRWSVTCGRGTAYGWIHIDVPRSEQDKPHEVHRALRGDLFLLLGYDAGVSPFAGHTVPAARDYRAEFLARARGEKPVIVGEKYWD